MTGAQLVPYDREQHAGFVFDTFVGCLLKHPVLWRGKDIRPHKHVLGRVLRDPAARAFVATPCGHNDDFMGWAAAINGVLVFAFVREATREMGCARMLLGALGLEAPIPVAYWTRDLSLLAAAGKPFFFDVPALDRLVESVH